MIIDRDVVKVIVVHSDGSKDEYIGRGYTDLNKTEEGYDEWSETEKKFKRKFRPFSQFLVALKITEDMAASIASRSTTSTAKSAE